MSKEMNKDENGRLPAEAYTPECIRSNLARLFSEAELPREAGRDILCIILDKAVSENIAGDDTAIADMQKLTDEIVEVFTSAGATLDEVKAGVQQLYDDTSDCPAVESLIRKFAGDRNGETLQ